VDVGCAEAECMVTASVPASDISPNANAVGDSIAFARFRPLTYLRRACQTSSQTRFCNFSPPHTRWRSNDLREKTQMPKRSSAKSVRTSCCETVQQRCLGDWPPNTRKSGACETTEGFPRTTCLTRSRTFRWQTLMSG
jgi:hypothetical protein